MMFESGLLFFSSKAATVADEQRFFGIARRAPAHLEVNGATASMSASDLRSVLGVR
jgi:hypothetical protein